MSTIKAKLSESQHVAMIQSLSEITKPFAALEKRRVTRVDVQHSHPAPLIGGFGHTTRLFRVKSVAEFGAAFFHDGVDLRAELGRDIQSFLSLGEIRIPVISRVMYLTPQLAGIQFFHPSEGARISIRSHFYLEFTAASLTPRLVTPPPAPPGMGRASLAPRMRWIKFANDRDHKMEVLAEGEKVKSFKIDLGHEWASVVWDSGNPMIIHLADRNEVKADHLRCQLISFLRNLKGVNPRILQDVGTVACNEEIEIDYPTPMA